MAKTAYFMELILVADTILRHAVGDTNGGLTNKQKRNLRLIAKEPEAPIRSFHQKKGSRGDRRTKQSAYAKLTSKNL